MSNNDLEDDVKVPGTFTLRKNYAKLPGKPDIVLTKFKIAFFFSTVSFFTVKIGIR